ncbi:MAG: AarF/UbiB family protein, partial [Myxococcota bacterium]
FIDGEPLLEAAEKMPQDRRDAVAERLLRLTCSELLVEQFMQTDPNPGNFLYRAEDDTLVLLDFGACDPIADALAEAYRLMTFAVIEHNREQLEHSMELMGFFMPEDPRDMRDDILDMVELSSEPLRSDTPYDFGNTDLSDRARAKGIELAKNHRLTRPPPPETLFVQRKLGGAFLIAQKIKARVACKPMLYELAS